MQEVQHQERREVKDGKTIHRSHLTQDYTVLPNALLRDKRLSFKARGLLVMMLSLPTNWECRTGWLEDQTTEGREAIKSALRELEEFGYATHSRQEPARDGKFLTFFWDWYDVPQITDDGKPMTANRIREPDNGNPATKKVQSTKQQTHKVQKEAGNPPPPADFFKQPLQAPDDEALPDFPAASMAAAWNRLVPSLAKITGIVGSRARAARARWQELGGTLADWDAFLQRIEASDFLTGRTPGRDTRRFTASFDWSMIPANAHKIREGKYDNPKPNTDEYKPTLW